MSKILLTGHFGIHVEKLLTFDSWEDVLLYFLGILFIGGIAYCAARILCCKSHEDAVGIAKDVAGAAG